MFQKKQTKTYSEEDSMLDLVKEDFNILPILSRFNIPLGFGNKKIKDICEENNIDIDIFLMIVNYILRGIIERERASIKSACGIIDFLHNSHEYFLNYKFPHIRTNLINALDDNHSEINPAIITFFDDYVEEVKKHFEYEEKTLFPYIRNYCKKIIPDYNIGIFKKQHDKVGEKLSDLKNIILRYYKTYMPNKMYDALVDIFNCEEDLNTHTDIEDNILVPMMSEIERS